MTTNPVFTAIVLAGSRGPADPVAEARNVAFKAFAPVAGTPMILRVLATLEQSPWIGRIIVCVDADAIREALPQTGPMIDDGRLEIVSPAQSPAASTMQAIADSGNATPCLIVTADHALLTVEMLDCFCRHAQEQLAGNKADATVALVPAMLYRKAYPGSHRTFIKFRDDGYSGCNLFALLNVQALAAPQFWRKLEQDRKKPWRMAVKLGLGNLIRFLLRLDSASDAITRLGKVIGIRTALLKMPIVEAAIDVDKVEDLDLVEKILAARLSNQEQSAR